MRAFRTDSGFRVSWGGWSAGAGASRAPRRWIRDRDGGGEDEGELEGG